MKGDFTKLQSKAKLAEKQYTGVYMQQGRLQLDSDWNTKVDNDKRLMQAITRDLIGGSEENRGSGVPGEGVDFQISSIPNKKDFKITKGRIYVNSILCELFKDLNYTEQEDHPNALAVDLKGEELQKDKYVAYLDVWERHLTVLDDPDIGEVALNGLDSTTRTKTVWQVKLIKENDKETEWQDFLKKYNKREVSITATATEMQPKENHLYRIEIHRGGSREEAKYKWSRDNGSVAFSVAEIKDNVITINSRGRDSSQVLNPGDWVEIIRDDQEKNNQPGTFAKLSSVVTTSSEGAKLIIENTLNGEPVTPNRYKFSNDPANEDSKVKIKVRRWDFDLTRPDNPLYSIENEVVLDSLIKVKFDPSLQYQTGDYWLLPVRVNEPVPEWSGKSLFAHGIEHHYLRLASSTFDGETFRGNDETSTAWKDERIAFPSLTNCISQQSGLQNLDQLSIGTEEKIATLEVQDTGEKRNVGIKIRSYPADETNSIVQLFDDNPSSDDLQVKKLSVGTVITINGQITTIKEVNPEGIFHAYRVDPPLETKIEDPTEYSFQYPIAQFRSSDSTPQVIITTQGKIQAKSLELEPTGEFKTGTLIGNQLQLKGELNGEAEQSYGSLQAIDSQLRFTAASEGVNFAFLNGDVSITKVGENNRANLTVDGQISANSLELAENSTLRAGTFIGDGSNLIGITAAQVGALVSVDGVSHAGGDIDLVNQNAITITPDPANHRITISENHSSNLDNPHQVTAAQVGALASLDGVSPDDNSSIDLISDGAITINPDADSHSITISETHSSNQENPHQVTAAQVGALASLDGVSPDDNSSIDLVGDGAITINPDADSHSITISETHSSKRDNPHQVTAAQVGALASLDGVSPDGNSSIDLVSDGAITINTDTDSHSITISETHSSNQENPHNVTAAQIGAVPTAGGTITGNLTVDNNVIIGTPPQTVQEGTNLYVNGEIVTGSSRQIKDNITTLSSQEVAELLEGLKPIKFSYKADQEQILHAGFLAEESPDLVTTSSKEAIYPVDILAILTQAVQEHRRATASLVKAVKKQQQEIIQLRQKIEELESGGDD